MLRIGIVTLCSTIITICLCPIVLTVARKAKAGQPILGYVTNHYSKSGTPTMGGIAFLISVCVVSIVANVGFSKTTVVVSMATLGFGIIGFLDDFIKIKSHDNKGLTAVQKLIGQFGLSGIVGYYAYLQVGGTIRVPFSELSFDLGFWAIPVYVLFFVGVVNFVNLTDGLDGLVSTSGCVYFITLGIIILLSETKILSYQNEMIGIAGFSFSIGLSLAVFYVLNSYPAKIFMGDTGSLGVGAGVASVALFSGNVLLFFIVGIVYCISGLSVVLQVCYYKLTKRRIFKMAPFHHHLERCGIHENKIVAIYALITLCCGMAVISFWR